MRLLKLQINLQLIERSILTRMAPVKQYSCEICGKIYSHRGSLFKHRKVGKCANPPVTIPKASKFTCMYCENSFSSSFSFKRHCERFSHFHLDCGQIECLEDNCERKVKTLQNLICHLKEHGHEFEEGSCEFPSVAEFESWKHQIENNQKCNFVKSTGTVATSALEYLYYRCHKSGKKMYSTTKKIGFLCTAYMNVQVRESGCVAVKYNLSHYRHENVLAEMRIPNEEKKKITQQLSCGIPPSVVLDKIRDSFTGELDRIHLITRKDLENLKHSCGIGKLKR